MATPLPQGSINRLRASLVFADHPELNVTTAFLTREGISFAPEGDASQKLPTMTGAVDSPEPYQMVTITAHLNRAISLANLYQNQILTNTSLGSMNIIPDSTAQDPYEIEGVVLLGFQEQTFDGNNASMTIRFRGIWTINSDLWNEA